MARAIVVLLPLVILMGCAKTSVVVLPGGYVVGAGRMTGSAQMATTEVMDAMKKACEPGRLKMWNGAEEQESRAHGQLPTNNTTVLPSELQQIAHVLGTIRLVLPSHAISLHGRCVPSFHLEREKEENRDERGERRNTRNREDRNTTD